MRLLKYLNIPLFLVVSFVVGFVYSGFARGTVGVTFSMLQHPFVTIFSYAGFLLLILPFDFENPMLLIRFESVSRSAVLLRRSIDFTYLCIRRFLIVLFNVLGFVWEQPFVLSQQLIYAAYTIFSFAAMSALYVFLSIRFSKSFAAIFWMSLIAAGFGLNYFGGTVFVRFNFLFFNMYETVDGTAILCSLLTYAVIAVICLLLTAKPKQEKNAEEKETVW